jgi:hypothetical protein
VGADNTGGVDTGVANEGPAAVGNEFHSSSVN